MRQESVLLRLVEAVDFIDEQQRALPVLAPDLRGLEHFLQIRHAGEYGADLHESQIGLPGQQPREGLVRIRQHAVDDDTVELRLKGNGPLPTESDVLLLRDGCLSEAGLSKSVARVFGLGMDLARGIVRRAGGSLDWVPSASDQTGSPILSLKLPRRVECRGD